MPADHQETLATALSQVPASGSRRGLVTAGQVKYFYGPMDCGKSTLALQMDHNHSRQGRCGMLLTRMDRSRKPQISSRIGITREAVEVDDEMNLADLVRGSWAVGRRVDYLIIDEAQFFTPEQVEQLAQLADDVQVDIYAFGIATDFRGRLFPGSARWFELADEVLPLQVEVLCWCGRPGRFNARVINGEVVRDGATVVVADTVSESPNPAGMQVEPGSAEDPNRGALAAPDTVHYQVLCRTHHRNGDLGPSSGEGTLPFIP